MTRFSTYNDDGAAGGSDDETNDSDADSGNGPGVNDDDVG